ncbi:MAG: hypothetical protein ACYC2H_13285 [Thermoplasmatota archaeon]
MAESLTALALALSLASVLVSLTTLWLAYLRPGTVRMTRPRMLFFTTDDQWNDAGRSKIVVIALLYATAKRKIAVETMWLTVEHEGQTHQLTDWFYKDRDEAFPSGLNVGEDGRALYHHFYLPAQTTLYPWPAGDYRLRVHARIAGSPKDHVLFETPNLRLPPGLTAKPDGRGFSFNWNPVAQAYDVADRPARFGP